MRWKVGDPILAFSFRKIDSFEQDLMTEPFPSGRPSGPPPPRRPGHASPDGIRPGRRGGDRRRLLRPVDGAPPRGSRLKPVVLEAREIGFGGSGRNGGQVIPGLKHDPDELVQMFGSERGERLAAFGAGTADAVFDLIAKHRMDVPHIRTAGSRAPIPPRACPWRNAGPSNGRAAARPCACSTRPRPTGCSAPSATAAAGSTGGPARCSRSPTPAAWPGRRSRPARRSIPTPP